MTLECSYCERDLRMGHAPGCTMLDTHNGERSCTRAEALPCPFCGGMPTIQKWHGGGPRKRLVGCWNETCHVCPHVCGSTKTVALYKWNLRA
jgi:hypothetical protein